MESSSNKRGNKIEEERISEKSNDESRNESFRKGVADIDEEPAKPVMSS